MLTYAGHYSFAQDWIDPDTQVLSTVGHRDRRHLDGDSWSRSTSSGVQDARRHQQRDDVVEDRDPAAHHPGAGDRTTSTPATCTPPTGSTPTVSRASSPPSRPAASSSATSASSRPTSWPARRSNPKRDVPFAMIGSMVLGTIIYILLQVAFLFALPQERDRHHLGRDQASGTLHHLHRSVRRDRDAAQHRLAGHDHLHRRRSSARPVPA